MMWANEKIEDDAGEIIGPSQAELSELFGCASPHQPPNQSHQHSPFRISYRPATSRQEIVAFIHFPSYSPSSSRKDPNRTSQARRDNISTGRLTPPNDAAGQESHAGRTLGRVRAQWRQDGHHVVMVWTTSCVVAHRSLKGVKLPASFPISSVQTMRWQPMLEKKGLCKFRTTTYLPIVPSAFIKRGFLSKHILLEGVLMA